MTLYSAVSSVVGPKSAAIDSVFTITKRRLYVYIKITIVIGVDSLGEC